MKDILPLSTASTKDDIDVTSTSTISIPIEKLILPDSLYVENCDYTLQYYSICPLIVYEVNGYYHLIDGCKRFQQAVHSIQTSCVCTIINNVKHSRDANYLRILLNLNRVLSFREKILFLRWLKNNFTDEIYRSTIAKIPLSSRECYDIEQLFYAPENVLVHIEKNNIDPSVVPELLLLDKTDQDVLLHFFSLLQFSRSFQREIIEWIPEIAFRRSCTIENITLLPEIMDILEHKTMNPPQKMQKIKDFLFRERFPVLAETKIEWTELTRKLNPSPANIQFLPSDSFEKNRLELKITISNSDEIISIFEKLKIITPEQWDKLIYPAKNFDF